MNVKNSHFQMCIHVIKKLLENTHSGIFDISHATIKKFSNQACFFNCARVLVLVCHYTIFNYTKCTLLFPQTPPIPFLPTPLHPLCRVKGDAEMNQCSALNEPIVPQSRALPGSRHDVEGVR